MLNSTNLSEIAYPVFRLGRNKPLVENGVVYYIYENYDEDMVMTPKLRVVDDTSLNYASLSMRRLRLKANGVPLFKIKHAIFFLGDLIKLASPGMMFIDSKGKVFNYHKETRAQLKIYLIEECFHLQGGGVVIQVNGICQRFKALFPPEKTQKYVGILRVGMSRILYGYYSEQHAETWRLV